MSRTDIAQRILQGKWRHASAALAACQRDAWASFAREVAPPRPLLVGRHDHGRCLALAERSLTGPVPRKLTLVPLWACSTEEEVSAEWVAVHGIAEPGEPLQVQETGPFIALGDASPCADAVWECTVRRWTAATVVESRSYSPEIPMKLRAGAFALCEVQLDEVVAVDAHASAALPRPTREVPIFASWFAPRVTVSPELESQIRALCFAAEDAGDADDEAASRDR